MDRRTVLALLLVLGVILVTPKLFPTRPLPRAAVTDTSAKVGGAQGSPTSASVPATQAPVAAVSAPTAEAAPQTDSSARTIIAREEVVHDSLSTVVLSNAGAAVQRVDLKTYKALNGTDRNVSLQAGTRPLLSYRLLGATDTVRLSDYVLPATRAKGARGEEVSFAGVTGPWTVRITYAPVRDSFYTRVSGQVTNTTGGNTFLLIDLPETLTSFEGDTTADHTALAYAVKPLLSRADRVDFQSLDPGERKLLNGPFAWAVAKSKYFMLGILPDSGNAQFKEAHFAGGVRASRSATHATGTLVVTPDAAGNFAFDLFTGPQQYQRLVAMGREFEHSNPYGGFMQGVVQPFATIVMKMLLWMKSTFKWSYGWILVLFGVVIRLAMWPAQRGALKSSIKMQRIQPELNALQQKYKGDPQRLQTEMMRVYKEHDMSPFSAFSGCLPMLLPMPIFFALFFVFQNTIEFRGVPFLWLHDISLKDPFYIIPLLMGVSMFLGSWISMRNMPPNPQAKMMAWLMPVMMTVLFANFASGLNLYYVVQNITGLPQQWFIANERAKSTKT